MNKKIKLIPMFLFGIFSIFLMGFTEVHASSANLVQGPIDNTYYTRRGGGQPYTSAQYNTYAMNGKVVYCIEPGIDITTHVYNGAEGWVNSPYSKEVNQNIQLIGYYGFDYPGHQTLRYRMAAQSLIWETVGGQIVEFWTEQYGNGQYINLDYEKNQIMNLVNSHYTVPSFNAQTISTVIGQTVNITDNNGVLSNYEIVAGNNATSSINGNVLSITPNTVGDITITLQRKVYNSDPSMIFVGIDNKSQKMGYFRVNDPVRSAITIKSIGGKANVEKVDSKTLLPIPRGDGQLKDAIYGIYNENDVRVGQVTILENGKGTSNYLPALGKFYLKEEKNSIGYTLDKTKYYFEITTEDLNTNITVYEKAIERKVELFKVYANGSTAILTAEPNITFEFYLKSSGKLYEKAITNEKGKLEVILPYGTYVVKQITTSLNHEKVDDFEIVIDNDSNDPITQIISNAEITSKLKLVKVDSESGKIIRRTGIKFKIKNTDTNEYICQNITYPTQQKICTFETVDGVFVTPYILHSGNYQIEELENQVIDGYVWNPTPLKFSINEDSNFIYDKDFGVMLEIKFANKQVMGEIEINKIGEKIVIENNSFKYEEIKLDGVLYNLYADGDIYSADGMLIYKDNELVTSFRTVDGYYKLSNLYLGKYYLVETESVLGHLVDSTPYYFKLEYKDQYTETVSLTLTKKNYLPKGTLIFSKVDSETGKPIPHTLIEIFTENNELIYSGYTDELGQIKLENIFIGKGYIIEKKPNPDYQITDEIIYFEITEDGQVIETSMSNKKIEIPIPNTLADFDSIYIPLGILAIGVIIFGVSLKRRKK